MECSDAALLSILKIGRDVSIRGAGISLRDAIAQSRYKELRSMFTPDALIPLIQTDSHFVEEWVSYSEDKRTSGGWYILESGEIGEVSTGSRFQFPSIQSAVANYVVRELDFWAGVEG
jgi:hypothetical protein